MYISIDPNWRSSAALAISAMPPFHMGKHSRYLWTDSGVVEVQRRDHRWWCGQHSSHSLALAPYSSLRQGLTCICTIHNISEHLQEYNMARINIGRPYASIILFFIWPVLSAALRLVPASKYCTDKVMFGTCSTSNIVLSTVHTTSNGPCTNN